MENLEKQETEPIAVEYNLQWIKNIKPQIYKIDTDKMREHFKHPYFNEPVNYKHCSFDNFKCYNQQLANAVSNLREWNGKGLVFLSSKITGSGKTHLAIATARKIYREHIYKWIEDNKDKDFGFNQYAENEFNEYMLYKVPKFYTEPNTYHLEYGNIQFNFYLPTIELIVIDDLFAGKINEYSRAAVYEICNTRITNHGQPTIITSNLTLSDIEKIDSRIASRLQGERYYEITQAEDMRTK